MAARKKDAVATKGETGMTVAEEFYEDADAGNEEVGGQDLTIPYLAILQDNSPQQKKRHEKYIEGAEAGMIYNSVTGELYDGESGIIVVNCYLQSRFVEWVPRDEGGGGGGFVASYKPGEEPPINSERRTAAGNDLNKTHYHMSLILKPEDRDFEEVVIAMARTQLKYSSRWNTRFHTMKWEGPKGKFRPPRFATKWKLSTFLDANKKGEYYSWAFEEIGPLNLEDEFESLVYLAARKFHGVMKTGVEVTPPSGEPDGGDTGGAAPDSAGLDENGEETPF
jgi:hypothetical protein